MPGTLDLATFRRAMEIFAEELLRHRDEIDSLNVYPVPDGDTGTNMLMTQEAVVAALASMPTGAVGAEELGATVSRASLMGARGNSGVILSQILRAMGERFPADGAFGPAQLAAALAHAAEEAYRAVSKPAEGTILSVMRDAAEAARDAARSVGDSDSVGSVIRAALEGSRRSLARTTELLPALTRAQVVDAGGKGIVLLLGALSAAVEGRAPSERVGPFGPAGRHADRPPNPEPRFGHEVQYLLEADDGAVGPLRRELADIGDSLVVVGGGGLYNIHVHTDESQRAVAAGQRAGRTRDVHITDLRERDGPCLGGQARAVRVAEQMCALVAVADGEGLSRTFGSLGALVVEGGPGRNPSVAELLDAFEAVPSDAVVVLPNHPHLRSAAERAAGETSKHVVVVPARSVPAGLSAAAAFNPLATLQDNAKAMEEAIAACRAGELARTVREADTTADPVTPGAWLGFTEGQVVAAGGAAGEAATGVVRRLVSDAAEMVTVIVGSDAGSDDRRAVEAALRDAFPRLSLEIVDGGQPGRPFLIGVE